MKDQQSYEPVTIITHSRNGRIIMMGFIIAVNIGSLDAFNIYADRGCEDNYTGLT